MKNIIFLIGMPGAGKTYWGNKISQTFEYPFTDLDQYIEEKEREGIMSIFARHGEMHFRQLEQDALHRLIGEASEQTPMIIACGGGTPCFFDNLEQMKKNGAVVYLRAAFDTLVTRMSFEPEFRPLLEADSTHEKLHHLMEYRVAFYEEADYILDVENLSVATFDEIINSCIKEH